MQIKPIYIVGILILIVITMTMNKGNIQTTSATCTDSDNGITIKGTVTDTINGETQTYIDFCESKSQVHEYSCNVHMAGNVESCGSGKECVDGACLIEIVDDNNDTEEELPDVEEENWLNTKLFKIGSFDVTTLHAIIAGVLLVILIASSGKKKPKIYIV